MTVPDKLSIVAFRAAEEQGLTLQYIAQHAKVLEDIGVASSMRMDFEWTRDPESTIIAAVHDELGMVGGVRIQIGRPDRLMAIEKAVNAVDNTFSKVVEPLVAEGTAELCGLWVAHRFSGHGLPKILVPAGVAVASQLPINTLLTFAAEYTLYLTLEVGFTQIREVGNDGELIYPIPSIRSYPLLINDLFTLSSSVLHKRHHILSLRLRPYQDILITPRDQPMLLRYALDRSQLYVQNILDRDRNKGNLFLSA